MDYIFNDYQGIQHEATFNAVKGELHSGFFGRFKKGISEKAALRAKLLNLRSASNEIVDLDFLKFFPNLDTFFISSERLSNISGIRHLTKAICIELSSNWPDVVDISVLSNCKDLEEFAIDRSLYITGDSPSLRRNTMVRGWEVLKNLHKLTYLCIPDMGIADISFLKDLHSLDDVELARNPIPNLEALRGHPNLKDLDIRNCNIEDISALPSIPNLEHVLLDGNKIKDFSPLKGMKNLLSVTASDNGLSDNEIEMWQNELQHIEDLDFEPEE